MQLIVLALAALATAMPAQLEARSKAVCPALDTPQCCQLDLDGVLTSTCSSPGEDLKSISQFQSLCAESGTTAYCCTVPVAGDGLLCTEP